MGKLALFLLSILAASYACDSYNILVVFPFPGKSHSFLGNAVVRHLLKAGHEVTYITPFVTKDKNPKLKQIFSTSVFEVMNEMQEQISIKQIMKKEMSLNNIEYIFFMFNKFVTLALEDENVQKLLQDQSQRFDLIIAEWLFSDLFSSLQAVYDAPLIWFFSTEPETTMLSMIDDYLNPAYNGLFVPHSPPFTFMQRLNTLWQTIKVVAVRETAINYMEHQTYKQVIVPHIKSRGRIPPSYGELRYNASLVLGNSYVAMGEAITLPQNYKHIGGFHIEEKIQPLPEDLQRIINDSTHGVIYSSMGSSFLSKDLPEELKRSFVEMFGTLKQTVLWKFEEELPDLPSNLHILKWAPQQSILAHPKCILFITHGGMLSTIETINAGKPTISIPVAADQFTNVIRAVNKGFAKKVDLTYEMTKDLKAAIEEVLTNPTYTEKAKELSFIFHDRPSKPEDELVHWAEHVIKTQGAPHLRSPALLVPWYQKYYLDLLIFIIVTIIIRIRIIIFLKPYIMPYIRPYYSCAKNYVLSFFRRSDNSNKRNKNE